LFDGSATISFQHGYSKTRKNKWLTFFAQELGKSMEP